MASIHCGQSALVPLPPVGSNDKKKKKKNHLNKIRDYKLPPALEVDRKTLSVKEGAGIDVLKINKVCQAVIFGGYSSNVYIMLLVDLTGLFLFPIVRMENWFLVDFLLVEIIVPCT